MYIIYQKYWPTYIWLEVDEKCFLIFKKKYLPEKLKTKVFVTTSHNNE